MDSNFRYRGTKAVDFRSIVAGAFRRSELVAIDYRDVILTDAGLVGRRRAPPRWQSRCAASGHEFCRIDRPKDRHVDHGKPGARLSGQPWSGRGYRKRRFVGW
jgi:hypothetical protein